MTTKKVLSGYRFPGIPEHLQYEDAFPSRLAVDPNDQPETSLRVATIAEIDRIWHSHSEDCWALVIREGIDLCVECDKRATKIVQHPWTEFQAQKPSTGALVLPVCGEVCHKKAFENIRTIWKENSRLWAQGDSEDGPAHATGTNMKDVRFTFIFPSGQGNLVYTHSLPAQLCANADDKNNKAVQRALQDELRYVSRLHAKECEDTLRGIACDECGGSSSHIVQMPLPVLNMPAPTVGVTVLAVCGKSVCARAIRGSMTNTMQEMMGMFKPMFGEHSPALSMLRCDSCGEWGKMKKCQRCMKVAYCDRECQRAAWKSHKATCTA